MIEKLTSENRLKFYSPYLRVFICLYLFKDIFIMWEFNHIIYESNSFLIPEISPYLNFLKIDIAFIRDYFYLIYSTYILLIILFLLGIGKRITPFLLFWALGIIQTLSWLTLNGGDNMIKFIVLYYVFIDSYSKFSLIKSKQNGNSKISNLLSNLGGYSICFHLCLVYFISSIHKIHADVWFNGVATYYILISERFNGTPLNAQLVKSGLFVTVTTYGTILIELAFPFLIWNKQIKFLLIILALCLHLGIAIFMMLYDFQILFIVILGFFITNREWEYFSNKLNKFMRSYKLILI